MQSDSKVELYDNKVGYEDETGVKLAPGLTPAERKQASIIYNLFNGLWGVCLIVGVPGTGKDLFSNIIAHKIKKFFPWKRILRDEMPRELFGSYDGLFSDTVLADDLARMKEVARGIDTKNYGDALEKAADDWVTEKGQVMLKNSLLYLTEYWRYCYKREPHNPMNRTMGGIHKEKRHLDVLILGTVQQVEDLDRFTCLPFVDWQVTCTRSARNKTEFVYYVQPTQYDKRMEKLALIGRPYTMVFDAGKPRSNIGDGKIVIKKTLYKGQTEEEEIVLSVLKSGVSNYEELVHILETDGDMTEKETLDTLKDLKFKTNIRAVDYPCWFGLYNSKSAPQLSTSLRPGIRE